MRFTRGNAKIAAKTNALSNRGSSGRKNLQDTQFLYILFMGDAEMWSLSRLFQSEIRIESSEIRFILLLLRFKLPLHIITFRTTTYPNTTLGREQFSHIRS